MRIKDFDDLMYYLTKYENNPRKLLKLRKIFDKPKQILDSADIKELISNGTLAKIKQIDNEGFNKLHPAIVSKMIGENAKYVDDESLLGLTMIVDEVAKNENVDISDLEYIGDGSYSKVYKLGNKVIKFGKNRLTDKIPYHKRILQPLIRRKILEGKNDLYIEISEYLKHDNTITDEDAYLVYKELREDGIIWLDAKKENLARLEKDNVAHFNEPINEKTEAMGYFPETIKKEDVLKKGDLVIIDTDCLYREQDFYKVHFDDNINTDFYLMCEQEYQMEKHANKPTEISRDSDDQLER